MAIGRTVRDTETDPFYDMLFNMLIAFVFCFIVALLAINPKALKAGDVEAKAEFIITLSWPDGNPNDIDTWVLGPEGEKVWFRSREVGLMHLDRDDRGLSNDTVTVNGQRIVNPLNQEVVTIRGIAPGEYVVNAHYYDGGKGEQIGHPDTGKPVPVTISVVRVNPRAEVVYYGQKTLQTRNEEATMVRFSVRPDRTVHSISTLPKTLVDS